jgi:uncharacterized protein (TIGR03435 family)
MSVFRQAFASLLLALSALAHAQTFESLSVKPHPSAEARDTRIQLLPDGHLIATAIPVLTLLTYAYDVPSNPSPRLSALPAWTLREKYDIDARPAAGAVTPDLSYTEWHSRMQRMIRALLAERFQLVIRNEPKTTRVYALTVAAGGPKLQKSTIAERDCAADSANPESCHQFAGGLGHPLNGKAVDMDDLARYIENWADLPVVNRTSLPGLYTTQSEGWMPMRLPPPPPGATASPSPPCPRSSPSLQN